MPVLASGGGDEFNANNSKKTRLSFHVLSTPVYTLEDDCVLIVMAALPNTTRPTTSIAKRRKKRTTCEYSNIIDWPQHGDDSGPRVNPATLLTGRNTVKIADHV